MLLFGSNLSGLWSSFRQRPVWVLWLVSDQNHQEAQPERLTKKKKGNAQSDAFTKGGSFAGSTDALPPPSPSVSATSAKTKGIDSQKQGQYDDAIKWLSC